MVCIKHHSEGSEQRLLTVSEEFVTEIMRDELLTKRLAAKFWKEEELKISFNLHQASIKKKQRAKVSLMTSESKNALTVLVEVLSVPSVNGN